MKKLTTTFTLAAAILAGGAGLAAAQTQNPTPCAFDNLLNSTDTVSLDEQGNVTSTTVKDYKGEITIPANLMQGDNVCKIPQISIATLSTDIDATDELYRSLEKGLTAMIIFDFNGAAKNENIPVFDFTQRGSKDFDFNVFHRLKKRFVSLENKTPFSPADLQKMQTAGGFAMLIAN